MNAEDPCAEASWDQQLLFSRLDLLLTRVMDSLVDTRVRIRSVMPMSALSAGTKHPARTGQPGSKREREGHNAPR